jgi:hypothetical protein
VVRDVKQWLAARGSKIKVWCVWGGSPQVLCGLDWLPPVAGRFAGINCCSCIASCWDSSCLGCHAGLLLLTLLSRAGMRNSCCLPSIHAQTLHHLSLTRYSTRSLPR